MINKYSVVCSPIGWACDLNRMYLLFISPVYIYTVVGTVPLLHPEVSRDDTLLCLASLSLILLPLFLLSSEGLKQSIEDLADLWGKKRQAPLCQSDKLSLYFPVMGLNHIFLPFSKENSVAYYRVQGPPSGVQTLFLSLYLLICHFYEGSHIFPNFQLEFNSTPRSRIYSLISMTPDKIVNITSIFGTFPQLIPISHSLSN